MNIKDIYLQGQTQGMDAQDSTKIRKISEKMVESVGNMEVPVTPSGNMAEGFANTYSAAEQGKEAAKDIKMVGENAQNLAVLTGEDCKKIEEEKSSLEKYKEESLDRAIERIHQQRQWKKEKLKEGQEHREELQESLNRIQAKIGLEHKSEAQIRNALEQAGLPATQEVMKQLVAAIEMTSYGTEGAATKLTDAAKYYLVSTDSEITPAQLYQSNYSGTTGVSLDMLSQEEFDKYQDQIQTILKNIEGDETDKFNQAKWLFANQLPIDQTSMDKLAQIDNFESMQSLEIFDKIIEGMASGTPAQQVDLVNKNIQEDLDFLGKVRDLEEADIIQAYQTKEDDSKELSLGELLQSQNVRQNMPGAFVSYSKITVEMSIQVVSTRRQLQEIQLSMTLSSITAMRSRGFDLQTDSLQQVVQGLRDLEAELQSTQTAEFKNAISLEQTGIMRDALAAVREIAQAPVSLLAHTMHQRGVITLSQMQNQGITLSSQVARYQENLEMVGTEIRRDLGDSIQKAFAGIPEMLREMDLEDTKANERAVRILGRNQMEITEDNIELIKAWDSDVNRMIRQMKPATVLDMIRKGINPLDSTVEELNAILENSDYSEALDTEEKYSKFLYHLEKNEEITQAERQSYIGIYRLLHQIESGDGAAIGAVLNAGQKMTLNNLLTAVRTRKNAGIDAIVDEENGAVQGSGFNNSITEQIQTAYYSRVTEEVTQNITPDKIQEMTEDNPEAIMDYSLEKLAEELQEAKGNEAITSEYYEEKAADIRDVVRDAAPAKELLEQIELPDTIENLRAVEYMLQENKSATDKILQNKSFLDEAEQRELDGILTHMLEDADTMEQMQQASQNMTDYLEKILTKSTEQTDISSEELNNLRLYGQTIQIQRVLPERQHYEIPVQTEQGYVAVNLTLLSGQKESGKVQINVDLENSRMAMELRVEKDQVKALVLCDHREGFEALKGAEKELTNTLTQAGFTLKTMSFGMDYKNQKQFAGTDAEGAAQTDRLYQTAKISLRWMTKVIKQLEA